MTRSAIIRLIALIVVFLGAVALRANEVTLEVAAGGHDRSAAPVQMQVPPALRAATAWKLTDAASGEEVPVQLLPGKPPTVVWMVSALPSGETRRYRLTAADANAGGEPKVTCTDDGTRLTFEVRGRHVLSYNHAVQPAPEGIDPVYAKSGFIHPARTPQGRLVTDDFPPDHAHQHGVFFAWVNTTFEGRRVDFWNQAKGSGSVEHVEVLETTSGPVFAQFKVTLRHTDLTAPGDGKAVLEETWTVRAYDSSEVFLVDLVSQQRCVADTPLRVNDYHYGGMGLRGNRGWTEPSESGFLTSTGRKRADGNHTRARWVIAHGPIDGAPAAVAVLGHPGNFRAPQTVRLHPRMPYFCFAPMVLGAFEIAPGESFISRYRYAAFDGEPNASTADRLWSDYADPPTVRVVVSK